MKRLEQEVVALLNAPLSPGETGAGRIQKVFELLQYGVSKAAQPSWFTRLRRRIGLWIAGDLDD